MVCNKACVMLLSHLQSDTLPQGWGILLFKIESPIYDVIKKCISLAHEI